MRDSISLISYAGCVNLPPVISANIHSVNVRKIPKNSLKTSIFRFQGRSRSSMLVPPESACYDKQQICVCLFLR